MHQQTLMSMGGYPPQQYPGQGYNNKNVIIVDKSVEQSILPRDASFSLVSTKITCPNCGTPGMTRLHHHCGGGAVLWSILLSPCLIGLFCCCMPTCKDKHHFCSQCGTPVGRKQVWCC